MCSESVCVGKNRNVTLKTTADPFQSRTGVAFLKSHFLSFAPAAVSSNGRDCGLPVFLHAAGEPTRSQPRRLCWLMTVGGGLSADEWRRKWLNALMVVRGITAAPAGAYDKRVLSSGGPWLQWCLSLAAEARGDAQMYG